MQSHHSATASRILDVAELLAQTRGFNGFSYADLAKELGLTTAAMHYHFATKAELGAALMARYHERFSDSLHQLDVDLEESGAKLHGYVDLYVGVLRADRMCLCGMLAAEFATLPAIVQGAVLQFLESNETWLASVLEQGRTQRRPGVQRRRTSGRADAVQWTRGRDADRSSPQRRRSIPQCR